MATGYLLQVRLPSTTNLPADDIVNTFAFAAVGPPPTAEVFLPIIEDFYNGTDVAGNDIAGFLSGSVSRARPVVAKAYDLSDPEPRAPIFEVEFTLNNPSNNDPLPDEVALCLSFKGPHASGAPASRHRGRVYIGPFNSDAIQLDTIFQPVPVLPLRVCMVSAAARLYTDTGGAWSVWSRSDDTLHPIDTAWVDNAWDTQRRRGRESTARTTVDLSV